MNRRDNVSSSKSTRAPDEGLGQPPRPKTPHMGRGGGFVRAVNLDDGAYSKWEASDHGLRGQENRSVTAAASPATSAAAAAASADKLEPSMPVGQGGGGAQLATEAISSDDIEFAANSDFDDEEEDTEGFEQALKAVDVQTAKSSAASRGRSTSSSSSSNNREANNSGGRSEPAPGQESGATGEDKSNRVRETR